MINLKHDRKQVLALTMGCKHVTFTPTGGRSWNHCIRRLVPWLLHILFLICLTMLSKTDYTPYYSVEWYEQWTGNDVEGIGHAPISDTKPKAVSLHATKALGGRGGIAPTHSRPRHLMVMSGESHAQPVLWSWGKDPRYPLYGRLCGPHSRSGHRGQRKKILSPLPGI
jgi:hypothetical protein